ncbi:MAG: GntR family transcriptional regulator [Pseudomonadota bacterium]
MAEVKDIRELFDAGSTPIKRQSLSEDAADTLREMILLEKLAPGTALPERDLSEALGISRTPMREAIRQLGAEGLVEYSATRRPRVANPSLDELEMLLEVQGSLEALAGTLACEKASQPELDDIFDMEREIAAMSETAVSLDFFKADMAFHTAIVRAARNAPLLETHAQYNARLWRARFISSRRRVNRAGTLSQHRDIAEALNARDARKAAEALSQHLKTAVRNIAQARRESGQDQPQS